MKIHKNQAIPGRHQKSIVTDVFYQENNKKKPIVIFCHGYKGFKDWGAWDLMATTFAEQGMFFIKFNFSHNGGTLSQPIDFPDLDAFAENNYSKELDDLQTIIDRISDTKNPYHNELDVHHIALIGHSRGGGIACIKASEEPKITKLVTWAGVSDYAVRFPDKKGLEDWKKKGVVYVENSRTKQQMPHHYQFYTDFKENEDRLTIKKAVNKLNIPYLIIHGTDDTTVHYKEAEALHSWNLQSKLELIEGSNHVFEAQHPWTESKLPENLREVVSKTVSFVII
ncbi:alpha/beta hydrolase [Aquimarina sp. ERC-38]|nr:alpha/beta hydrolase [Aquimarina sp. ERC-38]